MKTLRLVGGRGSIDLYPWLSAKAQGVEALAGIIGFGLPTVENQWGEAPRGGKSWRGARVGSRLISLPLKVYAQNRADLTLQLSELSHVLDPFVGSALAGANGPTRLFFGGPNDREEWFVDVVRAGGGDWARKRDSDDRTYFKTTLGLEAGDPFWTRNEPEKFHVQKSTASPEVGHWEPQPDLWVSEGSEVVSSSGFEASLDGWTVYSGAGRTSAFKRTGAYSMASDYAERTLSGLEVGKRYTFSIWGYCTTSSYLYVDIFALGVDVYVPSPTLAWRQAAFSFTATSATHVVGVTSGTATYWDDVTLTAEDGYYEPQPDVWVVDTPASGAGGLLPDLAKLRVVSSAVTGKRSVSNSGDAPAWPVFALKGPLEGPDAGVLLRGVAGDFVWRGELGSDDTLTIDMRNHTVEDQNGVNRYGGVEAAPRFWSIPPGDTEATFELYGADDNTFLLAQWRPRRWAMV